MTQPARVLVLSSRLTTDRRRALAATLNLDGRLDLVGAGRLPDLSPYGSVLLDGPQESLAADDVERLIGFVDAGGSLVSLAAAPEDPKSPVAGLLGAAAGRPFPAAEVFGKAAVESHELLDRLEREFPLVDAFSPLQPLDPEARVLLHVQWAFKDQVVALERRIGSGRIVATSLGNSDGALQSPVFSTMVRRAMTLPPAISARTLQVGLVGYGPQGGMGFLHGTAANSVAGLHFAAVCDRSPDRLDAASADFPGLRTYTDPASLAADPDVDIVIVATPPVNHATIALQMLQAGKHVVCEKPLCFTPQEGDALIAAARSANLVLTVNQNRRWDADFLAIRHAVEQGLLGDLFNIETFAGEFAHPCLFWHSDVAVSGGAVYDWGAHHVDWALQLMGGLPASVASFAHKRVWHDVTNADQVRLRMLWRDGREAEFFYSDVAAVRRPKFYIQGTRGTLAGHYHSVAFERIDPAYGYQRDQAHYAEAPADLVLARYESGRGISELRLPLAPAPRFPLHRNLADHLLLGEPLAVTPESARDIITVLDAARRSTEQGGKPIEV